jgi:hypothetical protein
MNVEDFYRLVRYSVKDLAGVPDQRHDANPWPLGNFLCALRPSRNTHNDGVKSILERLRNSRIMVSDVAEDVIQVGECLSGIHTLMQGEIFEKLY